jgi:hypothetical protein
MTKTEIQERIKTLTAKIGRARRAEDNKAVKSLRQNRLGWIIVLAAEHETFTLHNADGKTEFVDRGEYETRMVAWARRQGFIPRGIVASDDGAQGQS